MKKIIYVDMDGVLCDYIGMCNELNYDPEVASKIPGFFESLNPIEGALEGVKKLLETDYFDVFILSSGSWTNPLSYAEKVNWLKKYIPEFKHRVIFSDNKDLNRGDYLIDDRTANGAWKFKGELIRFGSADYPNWNCVNKYFDMVSTVPIEILTKDDVKTVRLMCANDCVADAIQFIKKHGDCNTEITTDIARIYINLYCDPKKFK